jgi:hypothetical protein
MEGNGTRIDWESGKGLVRSWSLGPKQVPLEIFRGSLVYRPERTKGNKSSQVTFVTGRGDQKSCETSRLPHFLDNQLTDGGEVVSLTQCWILSRPQGVLKNNIHIGRSKQ